MENHEIEEIYKEYNQMVYRLVFSYVKNEGDAEDLMQEIFIKRMCYNKEFESKEHEKRWMIRVSVNLAKDHLKSFWKKKRCSLEEVQLQVPWNMDEEKKQVLEEVFRLPDKCKSVIYLHYFEGYSCKEIGEILHCSESAVKMRLKKGRSLLKLELE